MRKITATIALLMSLASSAMAAGDDKAKLEEFSADLLAVYSLSGTSKQALADMSPNAQVYNMTRLLKQAKALQEKWKDSDFVEVQSFRLSGANQLQLDIEYRFK